MTGKKSRWTSSPVSRRRKTRGRPSSSFSASEDAGRDRPARSARSGRATSPTRARSGAASRASEPSASASAAERLRRWPSRTARRRATDRLGPLAQVLESRAGATSASSPGRRVEPDQLAAVVEHQQPLGVAEEPGRAVLGSSWLSRKSQELTPRSRSNSATVRRSGDQRDVVVVDRQRGRGPTPRPRPGELGATAAGRRSRAPGPRSACGPGARSAAGRSRGCGLIVPAGGENDQSTSPVSPSKAISSRSPRRQKTRPPTIRKSWSRAAAGSRRRRSAARPRANGLAPRPAGAGVAEVVPPLRPPPVEVERDEPGRGRGDDLVGEVADPDRRAAEVAPTRRTRPWPGRPAGASVPWTRKIRLASADGGTPSAAIGRTSAVERPLPAPDQRDREARLATGRRSSGRTAARASRSADQVARAAPPCRRSSRRRGTAPGPRA